LWWWWWWWMLPIRCEAKMWWRMLAIRCETRMLAVIPGVRGMESAILVH
jgi:hypothetical protein